MVSRQAKRADISSLAPVRVLYLDRFVQRGPPGDSAAVPWRIIRCRVTPRPLLSLSEFAVGPPWQTVGEAGRSKRRQSPAARVISPETRLAYFAATAGNSRRIIGFTWTSFVPQSPFRRCRINLTRITAPRSNSIHIHICMSDVFQPYSRSRIPRANRTLFAIRWRDAHFDEM